jgi:hypothetical protein
MCRFIVTLLSALAQLECEQIAEKSSSAMLRRQANGRRMTGVDSTVTGACQLITGD